MIFCSSFPGWVFSYFLDSGSVSNFESLRNITSLYLGNRIQQPKESDDCMRGQSGFSKQDCFRFTPKILNIFLHNPHRIFKVIAVLVALVFSQKILPFQGPLDHVEAFAGDQAVTLGELEDYGGVSKIFSQTSKGNPGNMIFSYPQVFEPKNRGHFGYNF